MIMKAKMCTYYVLLYIKHTTRVSSSIFTKTLQEKSYYYSQFTGEETGTSYR